ncbi:hypothetical protein [Sphingosinicella sp. BN140058]|uniref:hypothetical protein n=1 Tax=Sphingosinicella sp. BN140058 TaxID=1892855 RepID=UPI00101281BB|nr:hypothetical protein [Sphingosinicella sp. BN140058]QAY77473.1 hypothetical protein ETR14_13885 [Sphingosinicella sp. BN140058]
MAKRQVRSETKTQVIAPESPFALPPSETLSPAHELQRDLAQRLQAERLELVLPPRSALDARAEWMISQTSRYAGPVALVAATAGLISLFL